MDLPQSHLMPGPHAGRRLACCALVATLLVLGAGGCSKPDPKEVKAAKAAQEALVTGRIIVKSNRPNMTIEAVRTAAVGEPAPVAVKGADVGAAEQTLVALPPGKYTVTAHSAGWPDVTAEANVEAGRATDVAVNFKSGSLRLDSLPAGATVKQGQSILGKTPLTVPQLPPGEIQLTLEYPLWPALHLTTTINEGTETVETARLPHGRLVLESFPAGATVLFGNRPIGQTPVTFERFQAGTKKLTLQSKDFPPLEVTVALEDKGELKLSPVLANSYPELEPGDFLRTVWYEMSAQDPNRLSPGFDPFPGFHQQGSFVRNLNRKTLFQNWLGRIFRYAGKVKSFDRATGQIEFADQATELAKVHVRALLSPAARTDREVLEQLTAKDATFALYGRLTEVEEYERRTRPITIEFANAELLHGGIPAAGAKTAP